MSTPSLTLPILDMNSPHCATRVLRALQQADGISTAEVDLATHSATITSAALPQAVRYAVAAVREAGYQVATEQRTFNTTGITCSGCAKSAGIILGRIPGVVSTAVDQPNATATVEVVKGAVDLDTMLAALKPAGYALIPQAA
ncbi:MAG TPA: cation transporter [Flavobacteriales bacterium]|nr:cation transporter [Flavobacteriales bacterium]